MKKILTFCGAAFLFVLCVFEARAGILEYGEEKIVFAPEKVQKNVTWSENFSLNAAGLETKQLAANTSQDVWIQTHAFPIGLSWRPPNSANFMVNLEGSLTDVDETSKMEPHIFIRYSCDKVNWSTWYVFDKTDKKNDRGLTVYESKIQLPVAATDKYYALMRDWWKTEPNWISDEHEYCEWLAKKHPDLLAREMPFIGYVQLRIEKMSVNAAQNLKAMTINYIWAVGGMAGLPKDKSKVRKNTEDKWFFEAAPK